MTGTIQHGQQGKQGKQGQQGWQGQPKENGRQGAETKEQAVIRVLTPYFLAYSSSKADLVTLRIYGRALAGMNLELLEAAMQSSCGRRNSGPAWRRYAMLPGK